MNACLKYNGVRVAWPIDVSLSIGSEQIRAIINDVGQSVQKVRGAATMLQVQIEFVRRNPAWRIYFSTSAKIVLIVILAIISNSVFFPTADGK